MRLNLCSPVLPWAISTCLEVSSAQEQGSPGFEACARSIVVHIFFSRNPPN